MNITIHPLPGHPFLVEAREATRSPHELLGSPVKTTHIGAEDVLLTHPPVLLIHEGGGEQLLNRDAVTAQLNYRKRGQRGPGSAVPASLRVWVIDPKTIKGNSTLLYAFIFGPIQRMYYQKKSIGGEACWKTAMRSIEKNPDLKSTLENTLFDGEALAPRHYMILLSASQVGESSINHELGRIRDILHKSSASNERKASTSVTSTITCKDPEGHWEQADAGLPPAPFPEEPATSRETGFDIAAALSKISQAAERGAEQFTLGIETEGN